MSQLPPHNHETEQALLGALIVDRDAIAAVAPFLTPAAFFDSRHRTIYGAMLWLWNRRTPCDDTTLVDALVRYNRFDGIGGHAYLAELQACSGRTSHVAWYADQLNGYAKRRAIIDWGAMVIAQAYRDDVDVDEAVRALRSAVAPFERRAQDAVVVGDEAPALRDRAEGLWSGEIVDTVVPTGIRDLDRALNGGIRPGEFFVLAGRPAMGKSAVALHKAKRMRCLFVSLEMPKDMVLNRLVCAEARVPYAVAVSPIGDVAQRQKFLAAIERVREFPMVLTDSIRTTGSIEATIERLRDNGPLDAVIIDHIGRLGDDFRAGTPAYERMSALSWRCKELAMRQQIAVIGLCQLNREVEGRRDCTPYLSDLRESGRIEEDADHVALLYNRHYYSSRKMGGLDEKPDLDFITGTNWERLTIHIAKNRNGVHGAIELGWEAQCMAVHETEERWTA